MSRFKKIFAIVTVVTMLGVVALPAPASALTADELQVQIDALMAQLATLQEQLTVLDGGSTGTVSVAGIPAGHTWSQNLTVGSKGNDVMYLQMFLNSDPATKLADSGAGSPGNETTYFGPITRAAVVKFHEKYASDILAPLGLTAGTGFFGPSSRSKINALFVTAPVAPAPAPTPAVDEPAADEPAADEPAAVGELSVTSPGPIAGTLVQGQATANLIDLAFEGSGTITGLTFERIGVSANTTASNVYLFDGAMRLTDAGTVNSDGVVTFNDPNGLFIVTDSKTISVKSDIAGSTSGETLGMKLTAVTLASGTVSGLPVTGNLHSIASATLAAVSLGNITPSTSALDAANDVVAWQTTATISTRNVTLERLALRNIGSINSADVENFRLSVGGTEVASVQALDSSGFVTFDLSASPLTMVTGSRVLKVLVDVTGGASRNLQMSLRRAADISVTDSSFKVNITVSDTYPASSGAISINAGTMTVTKTSDSTSGNVTRGATDLVLSKYTFTAHGESIKVETLNVGVDTSETDTAITMRNVRIMVNGSQVGSTTSVPAEDFATVTETGTQFTTNFVVNPGSPATVEIRMDIFDNEGTNIFATTTPTIDVAFVQGSSNGVPQISLGTINIPTANQLGNQVTVAAGSITLTQVSTYGNQTIVAPQTAYKLGAFNLTGNSTEAVDINEFEIDFTGTGVFDPSDDLTDVHIKYGASTTTVKGTVTDLNNTWSVNFQLAINESMVIEVFGNIASTVGTDTMRVDLTITGATALSASTVYADVTSSNTTKDAGFQGQVITAGTGFVIATADASTPDAKIVDDSGTITSAVFDFTSTNDSYTITDITITVTAASAVSTVRLKDGNTTLATLPGATSLTFSGLTFAIPVNSSKDLTVELDMSTVGVGAGTTGGALLTTLTSFTSRNSQGVSDVSANDSGQSRESDPAGNATYVYKSVPTITLVTLPTGLLNNGTKILSKFTISSGGTGTIAWDRILFTITKTGGTSGDPAITNTDLYNSDTNTIVAGTATDTTLGETNTSGTVSFVPTSEQQISGAKTYELRATIGGTLADNDFISSEITQPSSFANSVAVASVSGTPSFVWSDVSAQSHSTTTLDWTNGFQVKNLPTSTQTMTK